MGKSERSRAKARAWKEFSRYIRLRDAIESSGGEYGKCITCGSLIEIKGNDAGHFIPGRGDSVLFDEKNCHLQCAKCNRFGQGMFVEYEIALLDKYGEEEVKRLKALKFKPCKYTIQDFNEIRDKYKSRYKALLEGRNE